MIIGLSELPETTRQRTIRLGLTKRTEQHESALYRQSDYLEEEGSLKGKCVLAALKCVADVDRNYTDNQLRRELQGVLGKAGREADDIWLPLFAIASAAVGETDLGQNPLLQELTESAKELSALRDGGSARPKSVLKFPGAGRSGSVVKTPIQVGPDPALVAALNILDSAESIEPEMLSRIVYECQNVRVSVQWLSKNLKPLGITAKKHQGRRVFMPSKEELQNARSALGIATDIGQQGHEGQQILTQEVDLAL